MSRCWMYKDGEHCFAPGVLRTVTAGSVPVFSDWSAVCKDDHEVKPAKLCHCGAMVVGRDKPIQWRRL